jgi:hypothetical protein
VKGLKEDNDRIANMYSTLTKSGNQTFNNVTAGDTACPIHGDIRPNAQFEQIKKEEIRA